MNITTRKAAQAFGAVVIASAAVVACTSSVDGTPRADPDAPPWTTTTSSPSPRTTAPRTPPPRTPPPTTPTPVPTRTPAPPGAPGAPAAADTTCEEYIDLDEDAQRAVIDAVAEGNELVALNPELWITVTSALCTFADPATPVREVLEGQGIR